MKKILFLTNAQNGYPEEDAFLIDQLKPYFSIIVSHPLECEKYLSETDGIIIRNIWPTHEYAEEWERLTRLMVDLKISAYNPLTGKGDNADKHYLADLYEKGFPVIPSISHAQDIDRLPESEFYWTKPFKGCDGYGHEKLTKNEVIERNPVNFIIQPYRKFDSEPSFFFIDNAFAYGVATPNRLEDNGISLFEPGADDLAFAQKFVDWNGLTCGIQRVDAIRMPNGELLLTEVEDIAPYLYLLDLSEEKRRETAGRLIESIRRAFGQ